MHADDQPSSSTAGDDSESYQHAHQFVVPHLPGEGRFTVSAKVSLESLLYRGERPTYGAGQGDALSTPPVSTHPGVC